MEAIRAYVYMVSVLTLCVATLAQGQAATDSLLEKRVALLEKEDIDHGKLITKIFERLDSQDRKIQTQAQTIQRQNLRMERQDELLQKQSKTLEETRLMLRQYSKTSEKLQSIVRKQVGRIQSQQRALRKMQHIVNHQAAQIINMNTDDELVDKTIGITTTLSQIRIENVDAVRGINKLSTQQTAGRISELKQSKRLVLDAEGPVAFHAVIDQLEVAHIGQNQNIIFAVILENLGGGYHNQHGIFIAPANGVYIFSVSIMSYINTHPEVQVDLKKDGVVLAKAFAHGDNGRHDQGSVTVVTNLTQGNEVWVSLEYPNDDSIFGMRFSSFTGSLLFRM